MHDFGFEGDVHFAAITQLRIQFLWEADDVQMVNDLVNIVPKLVNKASYISDKCHVFNVEIEIII